MKNSLTKLHILYDGNCPLCIQKVLFLQKRDRQKQLTFTDIRAAHFIPPQGTQMSDLERQIHALLPNGEIISRMDVVRSAYRIIGLGWLLAPTAWPLFRPLFDRLYDGVAKHRLQISRLFFLEKK